MSASADAVAAAPLVAIGIVSAPEYLERRAACRASWLGWPNVGPGRALTVHFVVRALHAPASVDRLLQLEQAAHGDVLRVLVKWNETRLRGPVLSVNAWLTHAVQHLGHYRFIAKMDDDAYLNAPRIERVVRDAMAAAPSPSRIYLGPMSWFHWYPAIFERSGFGWSYTMSWSMGRHCRNVTTAEERCKHRGCGPCLGPFPFASGFLAVLSTPLAAEMLAGNAVKDDDLRRLQQATSLPTRTGGEQIKVMEDIWLGSLLHRRPGRLQTRTPSCLASARRALPLENQLAAFPSRHHIAQAKQHADAADHEQQPTRRRIDRLQPQQVEWRARVWRQASHGACTRWHQWSAHQKPCAAPVDPFCVGEWLTVCPTRPDPTGGRPLAAAVNHEPTE